MQDLNSVTEIGRLTKDSELKTFDNGGQILQFSIAVNRSVKRGDEWTEDVSFFTVKKNGKKMEKLCSLLTKGKQVAISGWLKQDRWEKDNQKNSSVVIMADSLQLIGNVSNQSENTSESQDMFPEDCPF